MFDEPKPYPIKKGDRACEKCENGGAFFHGFFHRVDGGCTCLCHWRYHFERKQPG